MGIKSKLKSLFLLDDEEEEYEKYEEMHEKEKDKSDVRPISEKKRSPSYKENVVSLHSVQQSSKVVIMEPRVYADAQEIADHLKNRRAVVVNLQRIQHDQAIRIVDFLSGTVYAIGGDIQRIGTNIFLCTPDNVEVAGNISDLVKEQDFQDMRWR